MQYELSILNSDQSQSKLSAPPTQCIGDFRTISQSKKKKDHCRMHHSAAGLCSVLCAVRTEILTPLLKAQRQKRYHVAAYFVRFLKLGFCQNLPLFL